MSTRMDEQKFQDALGILENKGVEVNDLDARGLLLASGDSHEPLNAEGLAWWIETLLSERDAANAAFAAAEAAQV